jgi:hypothetical protein
MTYNNLGLLLSHGAHVMCAMTLLVFALITKLRCARLMGSWEIVAQMLNP